MAEKKSAFSLTGTYQSDLDLVALHESVVTYIRDMGRENRNFYVQQLNKPLIDGERAIITSEIKKIDDDVDLKSYQGQAEPLLQKYKSIKPEKQVLVFSRKKKESPKTEAEDLKIAERLWIISEYLSVAGRYAPTDYKCLQKLSVAGCDYCSLPLDGKMVCENCSLVQYGEVLPEVDPVNKTVRTGSVWQNVKRSLDDISKFYSFTLEEDDIKFMIEKLSPFMKDTKLTGKYLLFKLEQISHPGLAPESLKLDVNRSTLSEYDNIYAKVCKQANMTFIPSF